MICRRKEDEQKNRASRAVNNTTTGAKLSMGEEEPDAGRSGSKEQSGAETQYQVLQQDVDPLRGLLVILSCSRSMGSKRGININPCNRIRMN
jgi:hypothetical protein